MNTRAALAGMCVLAALALAGGGAWWAFASDPVEAPATEADAGPLPVPPIPPRIAEGGDYERCLSMVGTDPDGAAAFADAWEATGGGEGAAHCRGLAQVALGNAGAGAEIMETLAHRSDKPAAARASLYGQAGQAWLMAGEARRAYGAGTMALALQSEDPDLYIDRSVAAASLDRFGDALDDLKHALELDPRRADALVLRAAAWRHLARMDQAQDDVDHALAIDPENAEAYLERGILRQRRGDRAGARSDWERAMALAPDSATEDLAQQNLALLEAGPERR